MSVGARLLLCDLHDENEIERGESTHIKSFRR